MHLQSPQASPSVIISSIPQVSKKVKRPSRVQ